MKKSDLIAAACRHIEAAVSASLTPPSLTELAAASGLSPHHFHRLFKQTTGVTPKAYAQVHRSKQLKKHLSNGAPVTEAIYASGYDSNAAFYAHSTNMLGMTPARFRKGGAAETIRFAIGQCNLGAILVAATAKGLCHIALDDDADVLLRELQDRFPKAELIGDDPGFDDWVAKVVGFVEAPAIGLDLPLDIRGTAFQQRVWQALQTIPPGGIVSYADVARHLGEPNAVRAVAGACAANVLAVAIPCHRVLRGDGTLSGYRWGLERKQALLQREYTQAGEPLKSAVSSTAALPDALRTPANEYLAACDPDWIGLITRVGPCGLSAKSQREPYQALIRSVAYQQIHGKAAEAILGRFLARFPGKDFPSAAEVLATDEVAMRACGFSASKIAAIRDIAQKTVDGVVPTKSEAEMLDNDALIKRLTTIRGVGRWTVEMLLIFNLERQDVLPVDDFGVREGWKVLKKLPQQPKPRELASIGASWAPYRSTAAWYLWQSANQAKQR
ncbi:MAG TPA: methylated-DNA--[protein]-cysteine S-methyltransferase [Rhodocyclaceae bacterium]|nr:methylated-DNA--[protein]-cysteine S-methyltransferase [Rhodocyclaceae bacterium]